MNHWTLEVPATEAAAQWRDAARRARTRRLRRVAIVALVAPVLLVSAAWMVVVLSWVLRAPTLWALVPVATHVAAILLAMGLPNRNRWTDPVRSFRADLLLRLSDRAARLRVLCQALLVEVGGLFVWPLITTLVTDAPLRWGLAFSVSVSSLLIVWPLERIVRAQRSEGLRLTGLPDDEGS